MCTILYIKKEEIHYLYLKNCEKEANTVEKQVKYQRHFQMLTLLVAAHFFCKNAADSPETSFPDPIQNQLSVHKHTFSRTMRRCTILYIKNEEIHSF